MDAQTPETELEEAVGREVMVRYDAGERLVLDLSVPQAFCLLAAIQLALRHPHVDKSKSTATIVRDLGISLEESLAPRQR